MKETISEELTLSISDIEAIIKQLINTGKGVITIDLHFTKHQFIDTYAIEIYKKSIFIEENLTRSNQERYFFSFKKYFFLQEDTISLDTIKLFYDHLLKKIKKFYASPFLNKSTAKELKQAIEAGQAYPSTVMRPIRDFSLKMDTLAWYQGEHLENLSYLIMRDYMDRTDTITSIVQISLDSGENILSTRNSNNYTPEQTDFCEVYFYAEVKIKASVLATTSPIYVGITFITLNKFLENPDSFLSVPSTGTKLTQQRPFFSMERYDYSKIEASIKQLVAFWTEATPAPALSERLKNSFDVYDVYPLYN